MPDVVAAAAVACCCCPRACLRAANTLEMTCFFRRVPPFFLVRDDDDDEDVLVSSARWLLAAEGFDVPLESTVLFRLSLDLTPPLVGLLVAVADTLPDDEGLLPLAAAAGSICSIFVMCDVQLPLCH